MRFKFGFVVIDRLLHLFLWLMLLFAVMVFAVLWFFEIDLTAHGTGLVKCETWVDVKPQVSGIIREMKVKEGQWVSKGDVLFVFEDRERKLEVDGTALRIAELKIAIAKSRNRLELAEEKISGRSMRPGPVWMQPKHNTGSSGKDPNPKSLNWPGPVSAVMKYRLKRRLAIATNGNGRIP